MKKHAFVRHRFVLIHRKPKSFVINLQKNTHVHRWVAVYFLSIPKNFFFSSYIFSKVVNIGIYPKNAKPTDARRLHVLAYVQYLVFTNTSHCLDPDSKNSCCFFF